MRKGNRLQLSKARPKQEAEKPPQPRDSAQLEKSHAVLSKLKELEFHSRGNIEKLAELSLTIEEELEAKVVCGGDWCRLFGAGRFSIQDRKVD